MKNNLHYEINNIDPSNKKQFIRQLFDSIVPTYDLLNRILSLGIDIRWRKSIIKIIGGVKNKKILDLCCGTGDLSRILSKNGADVFSLDFSLPMILAGIKKNWITKYPVNADASVLPFKDNSFDILSIAFGIRNIPDIDNFISDAFRVLKPEGLLIILELTRPDNKPIGLIYRIYLTRVLPIIGGIISGKRLAYRYLATTISTFINNDKLYTLLKARGFSNIKFYKKTFSVATITISRK